MKWCSPVFVPRVTLCSLIAQKVFDTLVLFQRYSPVQRSPPKFILVINIRRPISPRYREDGELPRGVLLEEFS